MKTVFKYTLEPGIENKLTVPKARPLAHIGKDTREEFPAIWFVVYPPYTETEEITFFVSGTGWEVDSNLLHIGSAICGNYAWHVFHKP